MISLILIFQFFFSGRQECRENLKNIYIILKFTTLGFPLHPRKKSWNSLSFFTLCCSKYVSCLKAMPTFCSFEYYLTKFRALYSVYLVYIKLKKIRVWFLAKVDFPKTHCSETKRACHDEAHQGRSTCRE